jgi:hypothetical protein
MFQHILIPQLDEDGQEGRSQLQQDGAPPHYLGEVPEYLNNRFTGHPLIFSCGDLLTITSHVKLVYFIVHLHPVAHCYFTFTFLSVFCAAYRCF